MKKLMIALAAVAMAVATQAATYNWTWSVSGTGLIETPGTSGATDLASGTAYLFANLSASQLSTIVSDFADGKYTASGYEQTSSVADGAITKVNWNDSRSSGTSVDWTMIVTASVNGDDYLFISDALTKSRQADGKNTKVTFSVYDSSSAATMQASGGYAGAGWYTAVPEPTSGLLMLLGMAGLALKRKRA